MVMVIMMRWQWWWQFVHDNDGDDEDVSLSCAQRLVEQPKDKGGMGSWEQAEADDETFSLPDAFA